MKDRSNADLLAILVGRSLANVMAPKPLAEVFGFEKPRQMQLCEEDPAIYAVNPTIAAAKELFTRCMRERMSEEVCLQSPDSVSAFLCSEIGHLEHESFWCLWLDAQHRLIAAGEMFRGTLTQASIHPREVVKSALHHNAAAVIFAHNHPSGLPEPSRSDELLTTALSQSLCLIEVKVLDHIIVASNKSVSFAEKGLI